LETVSGIKRNGEKLQFVGGHLGLADLQAVTHLFAEEFPPKEVQFLPFTIFRDPNERLVSFWAYLRDLKGDPNMPLEDMLDTMLTDSMYRLLAPMDSDLTDEEITLQHIKDLLRDNFAVVGLTERFDETFVVVEARRNPSRHFLSETQGSLFISTTIQGSFDGSSNQDHQSQST